MAVSNATAFIGGGSRRDDVAVTVLKFLAATVLTSMGYMMAVVLVEIAPTFTFNQPTSSVGVVPADLMETAWYFGKWIVWMTLPAIPAGVVYHRVPDKTVDTYHRLGKVFALFIPINLTLSAAFMVYQFLILPSPPELDIVNLIIFFSVASIGLPGPYLGALLGMRWVR